MLQFKVSAALAIAAASTKHTAIRMLDRTATVWARPSFEDISGHGKGQIIRAFAKHRTICRVRAKDYATGAGRVLKP